MDEGSLLTLEEAATHIGYRKRELRALVREGRLPAVRAGKRWQVAPSDLPCCPRGSPRRRSLNRLLPPKPQPSGPRPTKSDPMIALIELLRERDQKLTELLEERSQLTGQVGFLLGQLSEREERIQRLEQAALAAPAAHSVNVLSATSVPVALLDEWTTAPSGDTTFSEPGSTDDSGDAPKSTMSVASAATTTQSRETASRQSPVPTPRGIGPVTRRTARRSSPHAAQTKARSLGLFRRRASA